MTDIDNMDGYEFEHWCGDLLIAAGFYDVQVTKASGDYGVDIIAYLDGEKYAIQCKRYSGKVGKTAVQEVHSGKEFYECKKSMVITNSLFTANAVELAKKCNVTLWDRNEIVDLVNEINCSFDNVPEKTVLNQYDNSIWMLLIDIAEKWRKILNILGYEKINVLYGDGVQNDNIDITAMHGKKIYYIRLVIDAQQFSEADLRKAFIDGSNNKFDVIVVSSYSLFSKSVIDKSKLYNITLWDKNYIDSLLSKLNAELDQKQEKLQKVLAQKEWKQKERNRAHAFIRQQNYQEQRRNDVIRSQHSLDETRAKGPYVLPKTDRYNPMYHNKNIAHLRSQYMVPSVISPPHFTTKQQKSKILGGVLALLLGVFGIHNFYLRYTKEAVIQLAVSVIGGMLTHGVATLGIGIWAFVEGVKILTGSISVDGNGVPLKP